MEKFIITTSILFFVHTIEEAFFRLWLTDSFTLSVSSVSGIQPICIYWIGQIVLYAFLILILFVPRIRGLKWVLVLLGVILLFEFVHPFASFQSQHYEPGLYSGIVLALYGIFYWKHLIKYFHSNRG